MLCELKHYAANWSGDRLELPNDQNPPATEFFELNDDEGVSVCDNHYAILLEFMRAPEILRRTETTWREVMRGAQDIVNSKYTDRERQIHAEEDEESYAREIAEGLIIERRMEQDDNGRVGSLRTGNIRQDLIERISDRLLELTLWDYNHHNNWHMQDLLGYDLAIDPDDTDEAWDDSVDELWTLIANDADARLNFQHRFEAALRMTRMLQAEEMVKSRHPSQEPEAQELEANSQDLEQRSQRWQSQMLGQVDSTQGGE